MRQQSPADVSFEKYRKKTCKEVFLAEMHQACKSKWHFGMKHIFGGQPQQAAPIGGGNSANMHDSQVLEDLLHSEGTRVWADSAYAGQKEVLRSHAQKTRDFKQKKGSRHHSLSAEGRVRNRTNPGSVQVRACLSLD